MDTFSHFVFVDFENVPKVDLAPIEGTSAHVTLLIGKKQTKIDTALSLQLNKFATQVTPIWVETSGRNALDIILASYLGRTVERYPKARLYIVSKDQDFVPLLEHLKTQKIPASRHDTFASLLFLAPANKSASKPLSPVSAPPPVAIEAPSTPKTKKEPKPKPTPDKFEKFVAHLRQSPPGNRTKLEHVITAFFKPLPAGGMKGVISELEKRAILTVDGDGKVTIHDPVVRAPTHI